MIKRFSAVQIAMLLTGSIFIIGGVTIIVVANNNNADDPTSTPEIAESMAGDAVAFTPKHDIAYNIRFDSSPNFCSVDEPDQTVRCDRHSGREELAKFTFERAASRDLVSSNVFHMKAANGYCRVIEGSSAVVCDVDPAPDPSWISVLDSFAPEMRFTIITTAHQQYNMFIRGSGGKIYHCHPDRNRLSCNSWFPVTVSIQEARPLNAAAVWLGFAEEPALLSPDVLIDWDTYYADTYDHDLLHALWQCDLNNFDYTDQEIWCMPFNPETRQVGVTLAPMSRIIEIERDVLGRKVPPHHTVKQSCTNVVLGHPQTGPDYVAAGCRCDGPMCPIWI